MRIPSTQALRALDSFARLGSVWRAADDLRLTRSAVSHQLRLLEKELGFELLRRRGKGIALTPLGRRYADDVRRALLIISDAGTQYGEAIVSGSIRVSCVSGFAVHWLAPRIGEFQEMFPKVALSIVTPRRLDDVDTAEVDVFIAFGDGKWPGRYVERLRDINITPVCSPALINKLGNLIDPADLLRAPLLHHMVSDTWVTWFGNAGVALVGPLSGIVFSDLSLSLAAAVAGQGVALADPLTCRKALDEGALVHPFNIGLKADRAYYLVAEPEKIEVPAAVAFADWLRSRLARTEMLG